MVSDARIVAETILGGRYRLVRLIDRGGMAEVWEGKDEILDRPVAVKVLHPRLALDEQFQERFRLEAVAAARLAHPNIVSTFDTGIDGDVAFIVMELVTGRPLREVMNVGPLPVMRAVAVAAAVADALDYAHEAGLVHRDVKPGNILVGDDGRVKVADFGIAKATTGRDLTQSGAFLGTAKYLAPEQVEGRPQDRRADVYSLGVVLYEMLCGDPPFTGDTDMAVAYQHAHSEPPRLRQLRPEVPRRLEASVQKAMAKSPDQRFQTAADMRRSLLAVPLDREDGEEEDLTTTLFVRDVPSFTQTERSWIVPVVLVVVLAVVLGTVGYLFSRSHTGKDLLGGSGAAAPAPQPARITRLLAFDPQGDRTEHDSDLAKLVDGNPATSWSTEHYDSGLKGAGKQGVGFVLELDGVHRLGHLQLTSPNRGWTATVYVADGARTELGQWGPVVATRTAGGSDSVDLHGRSGSALLVWITDLGSNGSVSVSEARLT
ncbi:MAG: Serine/threonine-protein kinase PknB [Acidimicrobiales bacterium]|nr:Serine/threonine-protein kinase PknB [Acidimicrobiales bacterium]